MARGRKEIQVAVKSMKFEKRAATKRLIVLIILIVALVVSLAVGTATTSKNRYTPDLALDLEGGTQLILTPVTTDGSAVTENDVSQAIEIIRQRVDASGVAEAEITSQGGSNIVVALPGQPDEATLNLVRTSAVLRLRPVLSVTAPNALGADQVAQMMATPSAEGEDAPVDAPSADSITPEQIEAQARTLADLDGDGQISDQPLTDPTDFSDPAWITEQVTYESLMLQCGTADARLSATQDDPAKPFVACDVTGTMKYILGPAELEGTSITQATSSLAVNQQGTPTGGWAVNMEFDSEGGQKFADVTGRIYNLESPRNQFAIVLDGQVLSAPVPNGPIAGGQAQITGNFQADEAASLANQLSFGSLPLNFTVQSEEQISATLGSEQLVAGLIAGLIGLALIVVYMIWQYHALGLISVASIVLSTGLSYLVICLLSWLMGYRLSIAGVLGMIVSVGVTADSFIVYFERVRDEIRDGRTIPGAVQHGWDRAKRTIIISDCVNLIASVVLYLLTVGSVRGFAFTLGITTVLDLIVVMMFTHPLMLQLMGTKYFSTGGKFSGLEESQLQRKAPYRGRGNAFGSAAGTDASSLEKVPEVSKSEDDVADRELVGAGVAAEQGQRRSALEDVPQTPRTGETLAQRKARQRREARKIAQEGSASTEGSVE